jgi:FkbM family methyltransferase
MTGHLSFQRFRARARLHLGRASQVHDASTGQYSFSLADSVRYVLLGSQPMPARCIEPVAVRHRTADFAEVDVGGNSYYWPSSFSTAGLSWVHQEVFAPSVLNSFRYLCGPIAIDPGDLVIDGGSSIGFFTRQSLDLGARVIAIEPIREVAAGLRRTYWAQIKAKSLRVVNAALGVRPGHAQLTVDASSPTEAHLSGSGRRTRVVTLDSLAAGQRVSLIKLDIEGAERDALRGAILLLKRWRPRLAIAVYHAHPDATRIRDLILSVSPQYRVALRGMVVPHGLPPRPAVLHAW